MRGQFQTLRNILVFKFLSNAANWRKLFSQMLNTQKNPNL